MPTNDLHRACGSGDSLWCGDTDWEAIERLGLITPQACAEKDDHGMLPLHRALENKAPEGVALALIDAHPRVRRHAESRRTKEFFPLGPGFRLGARWNRLGEAVKTRKKREKTGGKWARYV